MVIFPPCAEDKVDRCEYDRTTLGPISYGAFASALGTYSLLLKKILAVAELFCEHQFHNVAIPLSRSLCKIIDVA
jgi:hypothetical protein